MKTVEVVYMDGFNLAVCEDYETAVDFINISYPEHYPYGNDDNRQFCPRGESYCDGQIYIINHKIIERNM